VIDISLIHKAYEGDNSTLVRNYVLECYRSIFNQEIKNINCSNCIQDAAIKILIYMNKDKKYLLYNHKPLFYKGKWYVQSTLTDEIAEEYLKENPTHTGKFKKLPKPSKKVSK